MIETCIRNPRQRQISRHTEIDVPEYWEQQLDNVEQFPLQSDSAEFNKIRALFDKTMVTHYTNIVRIERIQNKPWYMQYNSYKNFSPKKDTETQLFHGCPQKSATLIIHSFFNRSFAGINGLFTLPNNYFVKQ
jgi:hypothetical protein